MTVVLTIIAWFICAVITCGGMMHFCPDDWAGDEWLCMMVCLGAWPIFALGGIGYIVLKQLSKIGMFFAGFLDKALDRKDNQDE